SDLVNFLECEHLSRLDVERAYGRFSATPKRADTAELLARKGDEYEQRYLEAVRTAHGDRLVEIEPGADFEGVVRAAARTRQAMGDGAPVIYQATFLDDRCRGHAD